MLSVRVEAICSKLVVSQNMSLLAGAFLLAVLPFESEHLFLMLIGAGAYYALSKLQPRSAVPQRKVKAVGQQWRATTTSTSRSSTCTPPSQHQRPVTVKTRSVPLLKPGLVIAPESKKSVASTANSRPSTNNLGPLKKTQSVAPVAAPVFGSIGWEGEVTELLAKIAPIHCCEKTVERIAFMIQTVIEPVFPGVEVSSYVCANIDGGKAFGVAVPEVDIVLSLSPEAVTQRMLSRDNSKALKNDIEEIDERALQKYAIRLCTERVVASSGLKFRRSAFRGDEPKVTFLAPSALGFSETSIPLDLSVNSLVPLHNAALLTECGQIEPRARALIFLVRRWAKDRGISHASKGHLQPYVWTLLAIYFLQVGVQSEEPLLPPVRDFELSSNLVVGTEAPKEPKARAHNAKKNGNSSSVGDLFKAFFRFYSGEFAWHTEAVAVWSGKRAAPASSLPQHTIVHGDDNKSVAGPSIEDPFTKGRNLGMCLTILSLARLKEEFTRADRLCTSDASLSLLLEPWAPEEN